MDVLARKCSLCGLEMSGYVREFHVTDEFPTATYTYNTGMIVVEYLCARCGASYTVELEGKYKVRVHP